MEGKSRKEEARWEKVKAKSDTLGTLNNKIIIKSTRGFVLAVISHIHLVFQEQGIISQLLTC